MAICNLSPQAALSFEVDDFTDPWNPSDTVVFLHGVAERGDAWRAWIPHFTRKYRAIRLDWRGFGESTPLNEDTAWSIDTPGEDLMGLCDKLGVGRFHLVSAKLGGTVAMAVAARYPNKVKSLSIVSSPVSPVNSLGPELERWKRMIREDGVRGWAMATMGPRLGRDMPPHAVAWWADMMGKTAASSLLTVLGALADVDMTDALSSIVCPTLVITTTGSKLGSVDAMQSWQQKIPRSRLVVIESDSYHIAASRPDECARIVREFIDESR